jgi:uncharacterized protein (TIGR00106 family)
MDKGESVGPFVAQAVEIIKNSGLPYSLGPMGTSVEGEWDEVMEVASSCFKALSAESSRVYMTMKVDWRQNRTHGLSGKVETVVDIINERNK